MTLFSHIESRCPRLSPVLLFVCLFLSPLVRAQGEIQGPFITISSRMTGERCPGFSTPLHQLLCRPHSTSSLQPLELPVSPHRQPCHQLAEALQQCSPLTAPELTASLRWSPQRDQEVSGIWPSFSGITDVEPSSTWTVVRDHWIEEPQTLYGSFSISSTSENLDRYLPRFRVQFQRQLCIHPPFVLHAAKDKYYILKVSHSDPSNQQVTWSLNSEASNTDQTTEENIEPTWHEQDISFHGSRDALFLMDSSQSESNGILSMHLHLCHRINTDQNQSPLRWDVRALPFDRQACLSLGIPTEFSGQSPAKWLERVCLLTTPLERESTVQSGASPRRLFTILEQATRGLSPTQRLPSALGKLFHNRWKELLSLVGLTDIDDNTQSPPPDSEARASHNWRFQDWSRNRWKQALQALAWRWRGAQR